MTNHSEEIKEEVRAYLLEECLSRESPETLDDSTALIGAAIRDSVAIMKLVTFLEERYGIKCQSSEMSMENFGTLPDIARLVESKML